MSLGANIFFSEIYYSFLSKWLIFVNVLQEQKQKHKANVQTKFVAVWENRFLKCVKLCSETIPGKKRFCAVLGCLFLRISSVVRKDGLTLEVCEIMDIE